MYHLKKDWYSKVSEGLNNYQWQFNDCVIIAESTTIRGLGWALEAEERNSSISKENRKIVDIDDGLYPFELVYDRFIEEYSLGDLECKDLIMFNAHKLKHRCPEKILNWLAFNPIIAIQIGWIYDEESKGSFRWVNKEGFLMVESIYWTDGNSCLQPPHLESESGSGWFVRASFTAYQKLKETFDLSHILVFTRTQKVDDIWLDKTVKKVSRNLR